MKPSRFEYLRPRTREEVDRLLAELGPGAKIIAGGQSLIPALSMRLVEPSHLIDINGLQGEWTEPRLVDDALSFGPLVRQVAAERSRLVQERLPLLTTALGFVAHAAIRSRGTLVGSIAHADPSGELPGVMTLLDGRVRARGLHGARWISAADLFVSHLETSLEPCEWIDELRLPAQGARGGAMDEFARRRGDYAICGVGAIASRRRDELDVSLAYINMAPAPTRVQLPTMTEDEIRGVGLADALRDLVETHLQPEDDLHASAGYRRWLAERLGVRAVRAAVAEAGR